MLYRFISASLVLTP